MSISITWGLIARMDGILSAEPLMYCILQTATILLGLQILYGTQWRGMVGYMA